MCVVFSHQNQNKGQCLLIYVVCKYFNKFGHAVHTESYTPSKMCNVCYTMLWEERKFRVIPVTPMMWSEPNSEHSNCYACLIPNLKNYSWKYRDKPQYPSFPITNAVRPVWPSADIQHPSAMEPQPSPSNAQA